MIRFEISTLYSLLSRLSELFELKAGLLHPVAGGGSTALDTQSIKN